MRKYLLAFLLFATPAFADDTTTLVFDQRDLNIIAEALSQMPWKTVNQTIMKIQTQLAEQAKRDAKAIEDAKPK